MKQDEKKPADIQINDPKPPVIHSGHFENQTRHSRGNE